MTYPWSRTVIPIALIFAFRMLGLFLLIPVFTVYANKLAGATATLIGIALGSYGLTQGLLQIPMGMLSDKWGRKPVITLGLLLFALGSLVGAFSHSIYGVILGRILQGTGAIGSVLIAFIADLTRDDQRTKAMAVVGMTIGTSFSLAMVISPAIANRFGLEGIFYFTALLAVIAIVLLHGLIPTTIKKRFHSDSEANPYLFKSVIRNKHLQRLNLGIFCQHFILTATFYAIPMILHQNIAQGILEQSWHFYLPIMVLAFLGMVPFIILAERKKQIKPVFLVSVLLTALCQLFLAYHFEQWYGLCLLMFAYFVVFNILEASLPSLISKQAASNAKGTAMGVYSTCQFLGIFAGGAAAGLVYQWQGFQGIFIINALLGLVWFFIALFMKPNVYLTTLIIPFSYKDIDNDTVQQHLIQLKGVKEVLIEAEEEVLYLRIEKEKYQPGSAEQIIKQSVLELRNNQ